MADAIDNVAESAKRTFSEVAGGIWKWGKRITTFAMIGAAVNFAFAPAALASVASAAGTVPAATTLTGAIGNGVQVGASYAYHGWAQTPHTWDVVSNSAVDFGHFCKDTYNMIVT